MKPIRFTRHAQEQCVERGATQDEVIEAIRNGSHEAAKHGRELCRENFQFNADWNGHRYAIKQARQRRNRGVGRSDHLHVPTSAQAMRKALAVQSDIRDDQDRDLLPPVRGERLESVGGLRRGMGHPATCGSVSD